MTPQQNALENLRVIRSLMEKAHHYRAISGPGAMCGGLLAVAVAIYGISAARAGKGDMSPGLFLGVWLGVLGVATVVNMILLARDAARRQQPFFSEGMRMALRAFVPPMLVGGVVGAGLILYLANLTMATFIWVLCYGLALLATASFSPRSLVRLGWCFVISGLGLFVFWAANHSIRMLPTDEGPASVAMGLTFGLLHVGYGLAVTLNPNRKPEESAE